jgi:hypothetical protein
VSKRRLGLCEEATIERDLRCRGQRSSQARPTELELVFEAVMENATGICEANRLKPANAWVRCCPTCQPSSLIGENPPYGMIGRLEETSASFEAQSAPRLLIRISYGT